MKFNNLNSTSMKNNKLRITVNALLAILILLSRLLFRSKRRVIYFNTQTGVARYRTTYYVLLFVPVWRKTKQIPK